jgi:prolyl oligopeptidase
LSLQRAVIAFTALLTAAAAPVAQLRPVKDTYFGTTLIDNYRWMEGEPTQEFRDYLTAYTSFTEAQLGRIAGREKIRRDIDRFSVPYVVIDNMTPDADALFYTKRGPADDVARLVTRGGAAGPERVLVDPETLPDARPHSEIEQIAPAQDGAYVAYTLADSGPDSAVLRIYDVAGGKTLKERIPGARFAHVAWLPDNSAFYYTRPVDGGPTNRRFLRLGIYLHHIGTSMAGDTLVLDAAHLPFAFHGQTIIPYVTIPPASDYALATISDGVSQDVAVYAVPVNQLIQNPAPWRSLATQGDAVTAVAVSGSIAFLLTYSQAPMFRVVTEDLADPGFANARTVVPAGDGVITGIAAAADALYAARREGSGMALLRLDYKDASPQIVRLPFAGTIAPAFGPAFDTSSGLVADPRAQGAFFSLESWMHPKTWLRYDTHLHRAVDPALIPDFPRDVSAFQALETSATAADGSKIPLSLIMRRDIAHDHARPVLIEAYGAYGYSFDARFLPAALAWADQGGIYAIAHIRGGGELGEPWRAAGRFDKKINSMTDVLACADALVQAGYTAPGHLAAAGSNEGAIAVAGAMLRKPDEFRAVLLRAGLLNPLRSEEYPGGVVNVAEFGSAYDPSTFPPLLAMDATQHVKDGVEYPAVLLTGRLGDTRAPAWHAAKMAAHLAAASTSGHPVLLRVAGQDMPAHPPRAVRDALTAQDLAFLLWQLDAPGFSPADTAAPATKPKRPRHRQAP